jgi:hypothetical protein
MTNLSKNVCLEKDPFSSSVDHAVANKLHCTLLIYVIIVSELSPTDFSLNFGFSLSSIPYTPRI